MGPQVGTKPRGRLSLFSLLDCCKVTKHANTQPCEAVRSVIPFNVVFLGAEQHQ